MIKNFLSIFILVTSLSAQVPYQQIFDLARRVRAVSISSESGYFGRIFNPEEFAEGEQILEQWYFQLDKDLASANRIETEQLYPYAAARPVRLIDTMFEHFALRIVRRDLLRRDIKKISARVQELDFLISLESKRFEVVCWIREAATQTLDQLEKMGVSRSAFVAPEVHQSYLDTINAIAYQLMACREENLIDSLLATLVDYMDSLLVSFPVILKRIITDQSLHAVLDPALITHRLELLQSERSLILSEYHRRI